VTGHGLKQYVYCTHASVYLHLSYSQDALAADPNNHGALLVPIILGSDKTTVSVMMGHTEYYPLYLSIGNVTNSVRRGHRDAVVVIVFLAIPIGMFL
jgi:hypothetical protein